MEQGSVSIDSVVVLMCLTALIGPVSMWMVGGRLWKGEGTAKTVSQGSALMTLGSFSVLLGGIGGNSLTASIGMLLAMVGMLYWVDAAKKLRGVKSGSEILRLLVAFVGLWLCAGWWLGVGPEAIIGWALCHTAALMAWCARIVDSGNKADVCWKRAGAALYLCAAGQAGAAVLVLSAWLLKGKGIELDTAVVAGAGTVFVTSQYGMAWLAILSGQVDQWLVNDQASKDYLSGALNRREFMRRAEVEVERCRRESKTVGCLMLDIDWFKVVNDTHGHQVGDEVIMDLSRMVSSVIRPYDLVGRYGGEEFVVIMPGVSERSAREIGERIRSVVEQSKGAPVKYTVSVGLCCMELATVNRLIGEADRALYEAKKAGRNKVVVSERQAPGVTEMQEA